MLTSKNVWKRGHRRGHRQDTEKKKMNLASNSWRFESRRKQSGLSSLSLLPWSLFTHRHKNRNHSRALLTQTLHLNLRRQRTFCTTQRFGRCFSPSDPDTVFNGERATHLHCWETCYLLDTDNYPIDSETCKQSLRILPAKPFSSFWKLWKKQKSPEKTKSIKLSLHYLFAAWFILPLILGYRSKWNKVITLIKLYVKEIISWSHVKPVLFLNNSI